MTDWQDLLIFRIVFWVFNAATALFAGTLFRMYSMYAEKKHWKLEILNENETGVGGYKEISFMITGKGAYSRLKFESGVHHIQESLYLPHSQARIRMPLPRE